MKDATEIDAEKYSITQAIHHLNMAVPKEVLRVSKSGKYNLQGWCPNCGRYILYSGDWFNETGCHHCGQRIVWKEAHHDNT